MAFKDALGIRENVSFPVLLAGRLWKDEDGTVNFITSIFLSVLHIFLIIVNRHDFWNSLLTFRLYGAHKFLVTPSQYWDRL